MRGNLSHVNLPSILCVWSICQHCGLIFLIVKLKDNPSSGMWLRKKRHTPLTTNIINNLLLVLSNTFCAPKSSTSSCCSVPTSMPLESFESSSPKVLELFGEP
ncbi:hypothetical protein ABFS83_08G116700 [Erythranthe nasuta]